MKIPTTTSAIILTLASFSTPLMTAPVREQVPILPKRAVEHLQPNLQKRGANVDVDVSTPLFGFGLDIGASGLHHSKKPLVDVNVNSGLSSGYGRKYRHQGFSGGFAEAQAGYDAGILPYSSAKTSSYASAYAEAGSHSTHSKPHFVPGRSYSSSSSLALAHHERR
jgi:hypothetical protein